MEVIARTKPFELVIGIDDGRREMLQMADILDKYGLTGIFYIAPMEGKCNLTTREMKHLAKKHEIGGHTLTHCRLTEVSLDDAWHEIWEGKLELEEILDQPITKFAYPRGWFNEDLKALVRKAGYHEARTMKMGIIDVSDFDRYEKPVSAQNYPRPEYNGNTYQGILNTFKKATEEGTYFNWVIHTDDIEKYKQWHEVEAICENINLWKLANLID